MKKKKMFKMILPFIFTAALVCMCLAAFLEDENGQMEVYAQDLDLSEPEDEEETVSGNTSPEPAECICADRCTQYRFDETCEVCREDFTLCNYVTPVVKISIDTPSGWHNRGAKVHISVEDLAESGHFSIKSVQAKISQNGSWTDVTEDMCIEISENCVVYVLVTDQKDISYEKSRYIKCFDFTAPVLNAAVNDGLLSVKAQDTDSGVKAVYVNGYEFTDLTNDTLNVRLEQFDTGYLRFSMQALDFAGNMSEVYQINNPYYKSETQEAGNGDQQTNVLPVSAEATPPASAEAKVTEHTVTDGDGVTIEETGTMEEKESADATDHGDSGEKGKEFYTIQTASEKVFYLIIDKDGDDETVYFLTEISENDLLNVTTDNSETLPKNSAALESAIPTTDTVLPEDEPETEEYIEEEPEQQEEAPLPVEEEEVREESPVPTYIILGIVGVGVIGAAYYFKVGRKKEDFLDEDDEEDDDETGEYDDYDEEEAEDDFFNDKEGETE